MLWDQILVNMQIITYKLQRKVSRKLIYIHTHKKYIPERLIEFSHKGHPLLASLDNVFGSPSLMFSWIFSFNSLNASKIFNISVVYEINNPKTEDSLASN